MDTVCNIAQQITYTNSSTQFTAVQWYVAIVTPSISVMLFRLVASALQYTSGILELLSLTQHAALAFTQQQIILNQCGVNGIKISFPFLRVLMVALGSSISATCTSNGWKLSSFAQWQSDNVAPLISLTSSQLHQLATNLNNSATAQDINCLVTVISQRANLVDSFIKYV